MISRIRKFGLSNASPVEDRPRGDRLVSGNPRRQTITEFTSDNGEVDAGLWSCEVGAWRIEFAANKLEFFHVISGRIRLHEADGKTIEVNAGQAAVIPPGFVGVFEVVEPVVKHFVMVERHVPKPSRRPGEHP